MQGARLVEEVGGTRDAPGSPLPQDLLFRQFADNIPTLAWIANADGYITWYNRRWHDYCGTTPEAMEGWGWQSVHDPALLPMVLERWRASIATGERFEMTFPLRGADSVFRPFLTRIEPYRDESGRVIHWFGTNADVSQQAKAEEALKRATSAAELLAAERAATLGQLSEGVIVTDADGRITFVNEAAERLHMAKLLDVPPEDYSASYNLYTEDGELHPTFDLPLARAVRGETVTDARWRIRRFDGSEVLAIGGAKPLHDVEDRQVGAVLTIRDDTARAQAERDVRESEARLRALTDNLPSGMVYQVSTGIDGHDRRFLFASQSGERMIGIPPEAMLADAAAVYRMIHPDDLPDLAAAEAAAIRDRRPMDADVRFRRADGAMRWCRLISAPREQPDGSLIWDGLLIDTTDQKAAEEALLDLNETLEERVAVAVAERNTLADVFQSTDALIVVLSLDYTVLAINRASADQFDRVMGIRPSPGDDLLALLDDRPEARAAVLALWQPAFSGRAHTVTEAFDALDGDEPCYEIKFNLLLDRQGKQIGAYHLAYDITDRLRQEQQLANAEEALRQSQKMEAIGQLTGGVAHDFNNLLTVIRGSADFLRRPDLPEAKRTRYIEAIVETSERAAKLTSQLLAFARRQSLTPTVFELPQCVDAIADMLRTLAGSRIEIVVSEECHHCHVRADMNQFEAALINLGVNARDAMDGEGRLEIDVKLVHEIPAVRAHPRIDGAFVAVSVSDTGAGIEPDRLPRIFEPFYTTKEVGHGTGLGLSQVFGFIKQSGGEIRVESEVGRGSTFTLYLPHVDDDGTAGSRGQATDGTLVRGQGTVLVVEDNAQVGAFATDLLEDLGYTALLATNGRAALDMLAERSDEIDIVFSDVVMPGMSGVELAREVASRYPALPIVLASGYSDVLAEHGADGLPLLQKPYSVERLTQFLGAHLNRAVSAG